ncbi:protein PDF [Drosophila madeirensis]|uniref:Protein PDF n=1 Tax=Drosophila madeirensis TaxID=30013 RepID=A0AAU9EZH3_DROMD|nr:protein PDF [Drosophila subobscura]
MARYALTLALLIVTVCSRCELSRSMALPDEERYVRKEYNRDLMDWFNTVGQLAPNQAVPLCRYPYIVDNSLSIPTRKRNSEIINSLLSLPKNMNEAG